MHLAGFKRAAPRGFTLAEMLVVVVILGIVATVAIPMFSSDGSQKLNVAAEETANLLRFAMSEARRSGGYVLVDGKTTSGQLALYNSNASGELSTSPCTSAIVDPLTLCAIKDPLTKRTMVLDVTGNAFSTGVTLTPQFKADVDRRQLLISTSADQQLVLTALDSSSKYVSLRAGSGVELSYGGQSVTVSINKDTGLVTIDEVTRPVTLP